LGLRAMKPELAEEVACPEILEVMVGALAPAVDAEVALLDHVHRQRRITLRENGLARRDLDPLERLSEPIERIGRQPGEARVKQRKALKGGRAGRGLERGGDPGGRSKQRENQLRLQPQGATWSDARTLA